MSAWRAWLLMAQDRLDGDDVPLTHEFLSVLRRRSCAGVTVALTLLERAGLIRASRGVVSIVDRTGLRKISNGAYGDGGSGITAPIRLSEFSSPW